MNSVSKNVYIDKLDDIVNKYDNRYHSTIKMKLFNAKSITYINSSKKNNKKDPTFKIGDVRISKYENIFAKGYTQNCFEEVFMIKKLCLDLCLIPLEKKLFKLFTKKNCKKQLKKNLELKR